MSCSDLLPDSVEHWTVRFFPEKVVPYIQLTRLDRPAGWWLLLLPCWWSLALATPFQSWPDFYYLFLFWVGAVVMHGAGSTYNDILDRNLDAQVHRSASRPLPSGRVSVLQAIIYLGFQCAIGLLVLCQFDSFSIFLGFSSMGIVALYPLMKRFFAFPQLILGSVFSWGGLMGWSVIHHSLGLPALWMYLSAFMWTIGFDTIYALQDIEDDRSAGIRSSAQLFGSRLVLCVALCYLLSVLFAAGSLYTTQTGMIGWTGLAAFSFHLSWQISRLRNVDEKIALFLFRSNRDAGLLLFLALVLDRAFY